jgi:hypothetical protein
MRKSASKIVLILVVVSLGAFCMGPVSYAREVIIKAGTPIPVRLNETVTSEESTAGQTVRFTVTRDVLVDDVVVIKAGSEVVGEVTFSEKKGSFGKEGKLFLVLRYAEAVDNTRVPLRAKLSETGQEKVALSWLVCPCIKGTGVEVQAGTETKAYVDYATKVNVD